MKKEPCDTSEHNVALQVLRQILKIEQMDYADYVTKEKVRHHLKSNASIKETRS